MKAKLTILVLAVMSFAALAVPGTASAQPPWLAGWCSPIYGAWYARGASWGDLPYYALYPPVYYRGPTPRTYGDSPVWYGGRGWEPQPAAPAPMVVVNQFVARKATLGGPGYWGAPGPKLIKNPYYVPPAPAAKAGP
jgi:hypothetical protein